MTNADDEKEIDGDENIDRLDSSFSFDRRNLLKTITFAGVTGSGVPMMSREAAGETLCVDPNDDFCYDSIQDAIDAADSGDVINVRKHDHPYNEGVLITKSVSLIGDPGGTEPGAGPDAPALDGSGLSGVNGFSFLQGVSDVLIEGFEIRNYRFDPATGFGRGISGEDNREPTSNVTIRNNHVHDTGWSGIVAAHWTRRHHRWTVAKNRVENCGYTGIRVSNSVGSAVVGNVVEGGSDAVHGILLEAKRAKDSGSALLVESVAAKHNDVRGPFSGAAIRAHAFNANEGETPVELSSVGVRDNHVEGEALYGIRGVATHGASLDGIDVEDNLIEGSIGDEAIIIDTFDSTISHVVASNNTIRGSLPGDGILLKAVANTDPALLQHATVEDNDIRDAVMWFPGIGIHVRHPGAHLKDLLVRGNALVGNRFGYGMNTPLGGTFEDVVVEGNVLAENEIAGVILTDPTSASGLAVHGNDIFGNGQYGIEHRGHDVLDATNNWWGAFDGPSGGVTGPDGTVADGSGDRVSEGVDFDPWLSRPAAAVSSAFVEAERRKLDLAEEIDRHTIADLKEHESVLAATRSLAAAIARGDIEDEHGVKAIERMILAENLTDETVAAAGAPLMQTVTDRDVNLSRDTVDIALDIAVELLFTSAASSLAARLSPNLSIEGSTIHKLAAEASRLIDEAVEELVDWLLGSPDTQGLRRNLDDIADGVLEDVIDGTLSTADEIGDQFDDLLEPIIETIAESLQRGVETGGPTTIHVHDDGSFHYHRPSGSGSVEGSASGISLAVAHETLHEQLDAETIENQGGLRGNLDGAIAANDEGFTNLQSLAIDADTAIQSFEDTASALGLIENVLSMIEHLLAEEWVKALENLVLIAGSLLSKIATTITNLIAAFWGTFALAGLKGNHTIAIEGIVNGGEVT